MKSERKERAKKAEVQCREVLEAQGWVVHYGGFLDFICEKGSDLMVVEVKGHDGVNERHDQHDLMVKMVRRGIPCFIYRPDSGFKELDGQQECLPLADRRGGAWAGITRPGIPSETQ